jgi:hypothetical protein
MSPEPVQCQALTKQGDQCRLNAVEGSLYCRRHGGVAAGAPAAKGAAATSPAAKSPAAKSASSKGAGVKDSAKPGAAKPVAPKAAAPEANAAAAEEEARLERARVEALAASLNKIADEVAKQDPKYTPPPFSPQALRKVLKANMETLATFMPLSLVNDILRNLEGTKPGDLLDPEMWKGLWYILNYTAQMQTKSVLEAIGRKLDFVPGMDLVTQFSVSVVESPGDLLDVETWKGAAVILNAALMANASALKRKVLGGSEE